MKKYWLGVLCVCCMLLTLPAAFASEADASPDTDTAELLSATVASGTCGAANAQDLLWTLDEDGTLTFRGSGPMKDYETTSKMVSYMTFHYYTTAPWMKYRDTIRRVVIPEGVTRIGAHAFYGAYSDFQFSFNSVTIADSVTSIGDRAFIGCNYLERANLPNDLTEIGASAFSGCSRLTSLTVPQSVTKIGESAFSGCSRLTLTVYEGSYAENYALLNNVKHESIPAPTPAGNDELSVLSAQVFPAGTTTYNASAASATSAKPGEIVALTVGFKNDTNAVLDIGAFGARLSYDKDKLELYNLFGNNAYEVGADFSGDWMTSPNVNANNDYVNIASFASGDPVTIAANGQVVMARFAFQVKSGAADGATQFIFDAARSYVADGANQRVTLAAFAPFTLTVTTPTPTPTPTTPGPVNVPTIEKLSYPFANSHAGFGYAKDYRIPLARYEHIFGGKVLSKTLYKLAGLWGGNCYGVSTTSAFFHSNADIAANSFNADADAPLKLKLSDNSTTLYMSLQEFIELMQVSQNSPVIQNAYRTHKNQLADLCAAVDEFAKTGANPVVIAVFGPQGGHALLGYKLESVSATQSRLYVYDSNFPQDAGRYLTLSVNVSGAATGWYYHLNDKYDWGSAFPGCWISYIPYADYCQVWDTRAAKSAGKPSKLELLTVNDDARIYDMEGMPIATIQGGELITGRDDMFPMITLGLTADSDGAQSQTAAVWLPPDLYTVERVASVSSADGPRLLGDDSFKASVTHEEQSADVSTTASKVTFAVDDESELNMVVIDENQAGELYDITLSSSLESAENAEVRLTGAVLTKALTFMQVSGEARYSGITAGDGSDLATGVTLTIDGQTFVPAKASMTSVPVASFSANGGDGSISPIAANENGAFTLPECTFKAPAGMTFRCWLVNQTEYQPGQACVITENTAVVAQWKAAEAPVREYALDKLTRNGGTVSVSVTNQSGAGGVLMIAAYSDSGKFLRCAIETVAESRIAKGSAATVSVKLDVSDAKTLRAVMLDADTQKPLSQPISG
ncbi:MAG: leucine-rich repeat protein [Oscillibacter sp.]|nr:leucine-rich repeat protein [Oscillibacter sp.]